MSNFFPYSNKSMSEDSNTALKLLLGIITFAAFGVIIWQGILLYQKYTKSDFQKLTESLQKTVWKARPLPPPLDNFSAETPDPTGTPNAGPKTPAAPTPEPTDDPSKVFYINFNDKGDGGELSIPLVFGSSKPKFRLVEVTKYGDEPPLAVFRLTWFVSDAAGVPISTKCIKMGDILMLYGSDDKDAPVSTVTTFSKV